MALDELTPVPVDEPVAVADAEGVTESVTCAGIAGPVDSQYVVPSSTVCAAFASEVVAR